MQTLDASTEHHRQHPQQQQQQQARRQAAGRAANVPLTDDQYLNASLALMAKLKARMCARAGSGVNLGHFCQ